MHLEVVHCSMNTMFISVAYVLRFITSQERRKPTDIGVVHYADLDIRCQWNYGRSVGSIY